MGVSKTSWIFAINSRDETIVICKFMENEEFDTEYLKQELELAQYSLPPPELKDIKEIMQENAKNSDAHRAAAFFKRIRYSCGSSYTSYACQPLTGGFDHQDFIRLCCFGLL